MPDARVFVGGGGQCGDDCPANHNDFEIYSPPYLFDANGKLAPRPLITNAPAQVILGQSFRVTVTSDTFNFALVRIAATTHTVNTDQRRIPLQISGTEAGPAPLVPTAIPLVTEILIMPEDPGIVVPGYYMLFALNGNLVPSIAAILHVSAL